MEAKKQRTKKSKNKVMSTVLNHKHQSQLWQPQIICEILHVKSIRFG